MKPKVDIIILNWNGKRDTLECLSSLKKIDYSNYKIVLVDNGSKDDSLIQVRENFPNVKIIQNKKNLGFTGGCNVGIKYALKYNVDYVLLLNNDTIVDRKFLSEMIGLAESDEKMGIVCPKVFYLKSRRIQYAGLKFNLNTGNTLLIGNNERDNGQFDEIQEMDFCGGTCMLVKKEVFRKIGLFDNLYFAYFEDTDFGFRARKAGYRVIFCPGARIWHRVSASSGGQSNPLKEYYMNRNNILFMKKHVGKLQFCRFLSYFIFESFINSLIFIKKRRFDLFSAKIKGAYEGIRKNV